MLFSTNESENHSASFYIPNAMIKEGIKRVLKSLAVVIKQRG